MASRKTNLNKDAAYKSIGGLVKRFEEQIRSYKRTEYNETLARQDFINPLFKSLGWDVDNSQGYAEAYREVIHEDKIKVGNILKAPDYSFKLSGGKRLFFVEAKKPSVFIKEEMEPAYQVRSYAWSARLPISILTDFEEFAVYDCSIKPREADKANVARIRYITYNDYLKEFDFLWDSFSKEKVLKGSFDAFIQSNAGKKGTTAVDKEFLLSLDEWRKQLAFNIALRNQYLNEDELNFVVQQTIDRIIFLRIAEDRSLEIYGRLNECTKTGNFYNNLFHYFQESDKKYNSGLFDFKKDQVSKSVLVDNKVIKSIISELYYPLSPYVFTVLNVEVLGNAYEQFLGKKIKLTPGHRAIIEEKPEVRKAGGVYYTPEYIVDYIVSNTIAPLLNEKTPKQVESLKIADISCGSGSFLLGAYKYLLDWHLNYYTYKASKAEARKMLTPDGNLCTDIKKRILLNNIYGVDIDSQAVEVTKLSLLLKCMEGETTSSINVQLSMFKERVLPTLDNNIKSGNSLIDADFYDGQLHFESESEKRTKVFNWQQAFPDVFAHGGFDAIIGNPPYIRIQSIVESDPLQALYYARKYKSASKGNYDLYVVFIEKALELINNNGKVGYILPHKFFNAQYGKPIRALLTNRKSVEKIIHFGHQQIFDSATTYTCIIILDRNDKKKSFDFQKVEKIEAWRSNIRDSFDQISFKDLENQEWNFLAGESRGLFKKLSLIKENLESVTDRIFQGLKTGSDKVFIVKKIGESKNHFTVFSFQNNEQIKIEKDLLQLLVKGGDSRGYVFSETELLIIFPYKPDGKGKVSLIKEEYLKKNFPLTYNYLKGNKDLLLSRDNGKMNKVNWYGFSRIQALELISTPKIFTPDISPSASFAIDVTGETYFTGGVSGGYGLKVKKGINELYVLGLLNSKLLDWYLKQISTQMRGGWFSYEAKFIKSLPIILPNNINRHFHDEIVKLVDCMLNLQNQKRSVKLPFQIEQLEHRIKHVENAINQKVYQLYGLKEEIKIIESYI